MILLKPDEVYRWNPHTDAYAKNDEAVIDWEGNVKPPREREVSFVLDDVPEDEAMMSSLWVSPSEGVHIDVQMSNDPEAEENFVLDDVPEDEAMMSSLWVSPSEGVHIDVQMSNDPEAEETITFEVYTFAEALSSKAEEGNFMKSIGSTYAPNPNK
jgi:hypothetical protein